MIQEAREAGYAAIGIDHFALPGDSLAAAAQAGRLHRNFQGYTDERCETLIGLGPSSISRFRQGYAQSTTASGEYEKLVLAGVLPVARGIAFSADDVARAWLIERLMCDFGFAVDDLVAGFPECGQSLVMDAIRLAKAEPEKLRLEGDRFVVPAAQRPLVRAVAARFDAYLKTGAARHSAAV
jgi:oxygen-independent coproporphyrinogen-3 oxidase